MPLLVPNQTNQQVEQLIVLQSGGDDSISSHGSTQRTSWGAKRKKSLSTAHRAAPPNNNGDVNDTVTNESKSPEQAQAVVTAKTTLKPSPCKDRRASLDSSVHKQHQQQQEPKPTHNHPSKDHRRASLDSSQHQQQRQKQPRTSLIELVEHRLLNKKKANGSETQKSGPKTNSSTRTALKKKMTLDDKQQPRRASLDSSLHKSPSPLISTNERKPRNTKVVAKKVKKTEQPKNQLCQSKQSHRRSSLDSSIHEMETQSRRSSLDSVVPKQPRGQAVPSGLVKTPSQRRFSLESAPLQHTRHRKLLLTTNKVSSTPTAAGTQRRKVHFDNNQYFSDCNAISREELHTLWYRGSDFALFKQQMTDHIQALTLHELQHGSYKSYAMALIRAYEGMEYAGTRIQAQSCLVNSKTLVTPATVGMETWVVRSILNDRADKRSLVLKRIQELRNLDPATRAIKARLVSRAISRPQRLFSHHIALLAAHEYNSGGLRR